MKRTLPFFSISLAVLFVVAVASAGLFAAEAPKAPDKAPQPIRVGIIGLDTSHVTAFTKVLNSPEPGEGFAGVRVVAAFPGGSPDIASSADRVEGFTKQIREMGVEVVESIPELLEKVDAVLLESVDGRKHLEQARLVFAAGKPVFIDKPLAASLSDVLAIADLAEKHKTPWFSSSSLRFGPGVAATKAKPDLGDVTGVVTWSPCALEPTHPDLYWYGVHGCELLYAYMGPGCQTVTRTHTKETDVATGVWKDGRVGTFRGLRAGKPGYGAIVFGSKGAVNAAGFEGYEPLLREIVAFFKTRKPPVVAGETIELMAFMEAADESKRQGGKPVNVADVMARAREQADKSIAGS